MKYLFFVLPVIAIVASIFVSKYVASKKGVKKGLLTHVLSMALVFCLCFVGSQFIASATDGNDVSSPETAATSDNGAEAEDTEEESGGVDGLGLIAAALAIGLAGIGGGIAVAAGAPAAIGATAENPDVFGKAIIFVVLGEAIALYGFVISTLIIFS
jgi:V/A-type H+-transporting ATPase subunit K